MIEGHCESKASSASKNSWGDCVVIALWRRKPIVEDDMGRDPGRLGGDRYFKPYKVSDVAWISEGPFWVRCGKHARGREASEEATGG